MFWIVLFILIIALAFGLLMLWLLLLPYLGLPV